jgi:hypothetical protein
LLLTVFSAASVNGPSPSNDNCSGEVVMADRVYSLVKGPAGWVLFLDGARVGGISGTKEAAFEAVMVAASFVVGIGGGIQTNVPSDARMRGTGKVDRRAEEVSAFFK